MTTSHEELVKLEALAKKATEARKSYMSNRGGLSAEDRLWHEHRIAMEGFHSAASPDVILSLVERVKELEGALNGTLAYERETAKLNGYTDCTCINRSRESERAYESGKCPHQLARAALAPDSK